VEQPRDWQPKFFSDVDPEEVTKTLPEFMEDAPIHVGKIHTVRSLTLLTVLNCTCLVADLLLQPYHSLGMRVGASDPSSVLPSIEARDVRSC
jgi:hypothetical protein